jgi:hypothetical protein
MELETAFKFKVGDVLSYDVNKLKTSETYMALGSSTWLLVAEQNRFGAWSTGAELLEVPITSMGCFFFVFHIAELSHESPFLPPSSGIRRIRYYAMNNLIGKVFGIPSLWAEKWLEKVA